MLSRPPVSDSEIDFRRQAGASHSACVLRISAVHPRGRGCVISQNILRLGTAVRPSSCSVALAVVTLHLHLPALLPVEGIPERVGGLTFQLEAIPETRR